MVSAVIWSCCPDYYLNPLGYDPLDIFRHELAHCNGWPANHPDTPMFSRPPQSQTHYLSTGPIGNENGLTIMTDRIAAIAAAATALNKFLKPLARQCRSQR